VGVSPHKRDGESEAASGCHVSLSLSLCVCVCVCMCVNRTCIRTLQTSGCLSFIRHMDLCLSVCLSVSSVAMCGCCRLFFWLCVHGMLCCRVARVSDRVRLMPFRLSVCVPSCGPIGPWLSVSKVGGREACVCLCDGDFSWPCLLVCCALINMDGNSACGACHMDTTRLRCSFSSLRHLYVCVMSVWCCD